MALQETAQMAEGAIIDDLRAQIAAGAAHITDLEAQLARVK